MILPQIIITIVIPLIFILFLWMAIYMLQGKGANLITGFNTLSREEKEKYHDKALSRFVGKFMLFNALLLIPLYCGIYFARYWVIGAYSIIVVSSGVFVAVVANGHRFKN